jgi:hypothetical protein
MKKLLCSLFLGVSALSFGMENETGGINFVFGGKPLTSAQRNELTRWNNRQFLQGVVKKKKQTLLSPQGEKAVASLIMLKEAVNTNPSDEQLEAIDIS